MSLTNVFLRHGRLTLAPIFFVLGGCASLDDRLKECGARGIEKRMASYQSEGGNFRVDLTLRTKKFISITWGAGNPNTQDGLQAFPCPITRTRKYKAKQAEKTQLTPFIEAALDRT